MEQLQKDVEYLRCSYSVSSLNENVLRMKTGLPKKVFWILANYAARFRDSVNYYYAWKVEGVKFEDQFLITLMKLRQNYTNFHLAQLFSCSEERFHENILSPRKSEQPVTEAFAKFPNELRLLRKNQNQRC